jgi:uncharacterized protein (UPF0332 family)
MLLQRARNELKIAKILFALSDEQDMQERCVGYLGTYYSAVITHSYYGIFYCLKSYLLSKGITIDPPDEHRKTVEALRYYADMGILDKELLLCYEDVLLRADTLLGLVKSEKRKRGDFTYKIHAPANKIPAQESIRNAELIIEHFSALA